MIIYYTGTKSLLIRSNGFWSKLADSLSVSNNNWQLKGNAGTTAAQYLGTSDGQPLSIRTNAAEAINISATQTVALKQVPVSTSLISVLVIDPTTGTVNQRDLSTAAFSDAIRSLNGLARQGFTIKADTADAAYGVNTSPVDSTITMNVPIVNGASQKTGLLTYADWAAFSSKQQAITIGAFLGAPNANGLLLDNTTGTLHLAPADASNPGGVSTTTQTFAGFKTLRDTLSVGKAANIGDVAKANSTLQVSGSMSMNIRSVSATGSLTETDNTLLVDASGGAVTITLPPGTNITGRVYTIKKIGGTIDNSVTIQPTGGQIEGGSSYIIYNNYTYVTLQTDGNNWYVIKK
ncbi:hypothetical protein [Chitinophaga sp. MM2321]|uniref:hypothetical protein n=1 Tax=Chitinophaga sp. MM2321 TaxID=3137178 RepID=UPI0032D58038